MLKLFFNKKNPHIFAVLNVAEINWKEVIGSTYDFVDEKIAVLDGSRMDDKKLMFEMLKAMDVGKSLPEITEWEIEEDEEIVQKYQMFIEQMVKKAIKDQSQKNKNHL